MRPWPNKSLQRTRRERRGCNQRVLLAGSLSWVVWHHDSHADICCLDVRTRFDDCTVRRRARPIALARLQDIPDLGHMVCLAGRPLDSSAVAREGRSQHKQLDAGEKVQSMHGPWVGRVRTRAFVRRVGGTFFTMTLRPGNTDTANPASDERHRPDFPTAILWATAVRIAD